MLRLQFVPAAGRDRSIDPRTPEGADFLAEEVAFLAPIEQVADSLGDVGRYGSEWVTADNSHTAEAIAFAGELEVDGWIIRPGSI